MASWYKAFIPRADSRWVFVVTMLCYEMFIARVSSELVRILGLWPTVADKVTQTNRPARPGIEDIGAFAFFVAPLVESLLLVGVIELLSYFKLHTHSQVIGAAILMSLLHAIEFPIWGLLVLPLFVIDASTFVFWRNRSVWRALLMVFALHLLSNAVSTLHILSRRA